MKLVFIAAGGIVGLVGLAIWMFPLYQFVQPKWIPISAPISLVSNFSLHTNFSANTPGRYSVYVVFDTESLRLEDDTPEDVFDHPRRIPAHVELEIAGREGILFEKSLTELVLGSEGSETVDYRLGTFDLEQQDQILISFSNRPLPDSVRTGNPRLEMRLSAATYEDRLFAVAVGKRRGIPLAVFGLVLLVAGLLLPMKRVRNGGNGSETGRPLGREVNR